MPQSRGTAREQRKLQRRLHSAKLRYPATLEAVDFTHPRRLNRQQVLTLGACAWIAERHNLLLIGPHRGREEFPLVRVRRTGRVEGRRVAGRASVADPALSHRAAIRGPWARFLPPLSEPGVPIFGTGLSSGIMRLAHGLPGRGERSGVASRGTAARTLAPAGRCVVRPVDALTTATARVVPFACACDDVRHCCSSPGY